MGRSVRAMPYYAMLLLHASIRCWPLHIFLFDRHSQSNRQSSLAEPSHTPSQSSIGAY